MPKKEIDALFESWDPDGSGRLELKEIEKQLRRGADVQLDPKLQAGSMGKIETKSKNKSSREGDKAPKGHGARIGAVGKQGAAGDQSRKTGGA